MRKLSLYQSGIHYANILFKENKVYHEKLNVETNSFDEIVELDKDQNDFYLDFTKIDLLSLNNKIESYKKTFGNSEIKIGERVISEYEETYSRLDKNLFVQRSKKFPLDIVVVEDKLIGFVCVSRESCTVLIEEGYEDYAILKIWKDKFKNEKLYAVANNGTHMVKMRDGVHLSTNVFLPKDIEGKVPAILIRTPYGKELLSNMYFKYVQRGYALVIQDVRGRNFSEGEWNPNYHEMEDGDDTLNWIASKSWSNERVGMIGGSYLGYVQWAAASSGNKYLKALISIVTSGSPFVDIPRKGGTLVSGMLAWAFAVSQKKFKPELMDRDDWGEVLNIRPLEDLPKKVLGYDVNFLSEWFKHMDCDEYWQKQSWHRRKEFVKVPAMVVSGWYDDNGMGTTEALDIIKDFKEGDRKVFLGPWMHSANTTRDIHNVAFGDNALRFDLDYYYLSWFDNKLKLIENGIDKTAPVEYYTVGENKWNTATNWPLPSLEYKEAYLTSKGNAVSSNGDGKISFEKLEFESKDTFKYDPNDPAIHLIDMSENEIGVPENYKDEEKRSNIICYTSDVFEEELTITGDLQVKFFASSTSKDTDWVVRLTEVDEEGNSIKLVDGILCARYRNSFTEPEFMEEGEVYEFTIKTSKVSNTFKKGSKMRLTITSSAKNFIFPNSNTVDGYNSKTYICADNTIYHGSKYPSRIILPVENR